MSLSGVAGGFDAVPDLMRAVVDAHGDRDAYVEVDRRITFGQWERAAGGLASLLTERGIGAGDIVCLMLPSSIDYAIAFLATMQLGAIATGINLRLGPGEVRHIIAKTEAKLVIIDESVTPPVPDDRILRRAELVAAAELDPPARRPRLRADDVAAIVWTSGTTGFPKGAVFDHARLAAMSAGSGVLSEPGDRRLSATPFPHVGYMTRIWEELANVVTSVIPPTPWRAEAALNLIGRELVTVGQGVPTQWWLMLRHANFDSTDFSGMRIAAIGSSHIPPELVRTIQTRIGVPVITTYTSTEGCIGTRTKVGDPPEVVAHTSGIANPGVEVAILDDDGRALGPDEVGNIKVRSPAVMKGYWQEPELTAEVLDSDGWLSTGDLGRLNADGYLTVVGRRKEMYIRGGYNVYPAEVEGVLMDHPSIAQVGVVGLGDPVLGEIGVAFIVPEDGANLSSDDVRGWVLDRLADYKAPDRVVFTDALPLTAMQKIDKRQLVEDAAAAHAQS